MFADSDDATGTSRASCMKPVLGFQAGVTTIGVSESSSSDESAHVQGWPRLAGSFQHPGDGEHWVDLLRGAVCAGRAGTEM